MCLNRKKNTALIDTNILYYLSGVDCNNNSIDTRILKREMRKLGKPVVSEISLLELCTHREFSEEQKKHVWEYATSSKVAKVIPFPNNFQIPSILDIGPILDEQSTEQIFKLKIDIEAAVLKSCISFMAFFLYCFLYESLSEDEAKKLCSDQVYALLAGNEGFLFDKSKMILSAYYNEGKDAKEPIADLLDIILYATFSCYQTSYQGVSLLDISNDPSCFMEKESMPYFKLKNQIFNAKHGMLCKKEYWTRLDACLLSTKQTFEKEYPQEKGYASYYCCFAKKYFTQGKKFEKNNLIDSLFRFYDSQYLVYTLDSLLIKTYEGSTHYKSLQALEDKTIKKKK